MTTVLMAFYVCHVVVFALTAPPELSHCLPVLLHDHRKHVLLPIQGFRGVRTKNLQSNVFLFKGFPGYGNAYLFESLVFANIIVCDRTDLNFMATLGHFLFEMY